MLSDHIGDALIGHFSLFNLIGRISFPIFAFQSVEGYIHTKNFKKHMIKLLIFACISQIPFILFLNTFTKDFSLNIFFTFFLGLLTIFIYDKCNNKFIGIISVIFLTILAQLIKVDYGAYGIALIFIFYIFREEKIAMIVSSILAISIYYITKMVVFPNSILNYVYCIIFSSISLIFITFYNKKEGPKTKYLFYTFYPIHLLILYFLHTIL